eukprot:5943154-Ditylum_brightwellii.AAC.1
MIVTDQGSGFPEIWIMKKKESRYAVQIFDMNWLCRYLHLQEVINKNGEHFIGKEFQELLHSYGIKDVPTTVKNPQANLIVERIHMMIGNMLQMT